MQRIVVNPQLPLKVVLVGECGSGKTEYSYPLAHALKEAGVVDVQRYDQSMAIRMGYDDWHLKEHGWSPGTANSEERKREHAQGINAYSAACMAEDRFCWSKYYLGRSESMVLTGGMRTDADEEFVWTLPFFFVAKVHAHPAVCARRIGEEVYGVRSQNPMEKRAREFTRYDVLILNNDDDRDRLERDVNRLLGQVREKYEMALALLGRSVQVPAPSGAPPLHGLVYAN